MCGRFALIAEPADVKTHFDLLRIPEFKSSYNIPPGGKILTIVKKKHGGYKGANLLWGLIPSWSKNKNISHKLINARAETIAEKPAFKTAIRHHRCLIPTTGYYEWQHLNGTKQAYSIRSHDQQLFAFAGIWEVWQAADETIYSCSIITRAANSQLSPVHHRMPVIINASQYATWLNPETSLQHLSTLYDCGVKNDLQYHPVSDWVNNPRNDGPLCLAN